MFHLRLRQHSPPLPERPCYRLSRLGIFIQGRGPFGRSSEIASIATAASAPSKRSAFAEAAVNRRRSNFARSDNGSPALYEYSEPAKAPQCLSGFPIKQYKDSSNGGLSSLSSVRLLYLSPISQLYISSYCLAELFHEKSFAMALSTILFHSRFLS